MSQMLCLVGLLLHPLLSLLLLSWTPLELEGVDYNTSITPTIPFQTASTTSIVISNVPYNTQYTITVVASNCVGSSMDTISISYSKSSILILSPNIYLSTPNLVITPNTVLVPDSSIVHTLYRIGKCEINCK